MQKGSVNKFVEALESSETLLDHSQMRFTCGETVFESPWGMFISYVCPQDWVLSWDGVTYTQSRGQFVPSEIFLKRCKVKNCPFDLADKFETLSSKAKIVRFLRLFGKWV